MRDLYRTPKPPLPIVYAIAAATPMGAYFMTMFVNLNIVSASDSQSSMTGRALGPTIVSAIAKINDHTTICRTSPSAMACTIEFGTVWSRI